jgi:hypothetical protein
VTVHDQVRDRIHVELDLLSAIEQRLGLLQDDTALRTAFRRIR